MKDIKEEIKKLHIKLQNEAGFKLGDKVKIIREAKDFESGWRNVWTKEMTQNINKIGKIINIYDDIVVRTGKDSWGYPFFVLEKVEQTYHVGQHFIYNNDTEYLLATLHRNEINLFNLSNGGRWSSSTKVLNDQKITKDEMEQLANRLGQWKNFKLKEE